jgi:hypothetical protein
MLRVIVRRIVDSAGVAADRHARAVWLARLLLA